MDKNNRLSFSSLTASHTFLSSVFWPSVILPYSNHTSHPCSSNCPFFHSTSNTYTSIPVLFRPAMTCEVASRLTGRIISPSDPVPPSTQIGPRSVFRGSHSRTLPPTHAGLTSAPTLL